MTTACSAKRQPMPELQLRQAGTECSYIALLKASQALTDEDLGLLEEDLSHYARTGLVGVHMSRLLALLQLNLSVKSARKKCVDLPEMEPSASQDDHEWQAAAA